MIVCDETNVASAAVPRKLGFTLDGIVDADRKAPGDSGRDMVWLRRRTPDDAVEFETSPNRTITRIGDTVHRPFERWTPAVHELLRYLEAVGFDATPRVLGIDREGREILSFVPGDSGARGWAYVVPDDGLRAYARLLRRYHDAVRTYLPPPDAIWSRTTGAPGPGELVCHGDCGPWNVVWRDGDPVALVDFDHARPGVAARRRRVRARVQRALPRRRRVRPLAALLRTPESRSPHRGVRRGVRAHEHRRPGGPRHRTPGAGRPGGGRPRAGGRGTAGLLGGEGISTPSSRHEFAGARRIVTSSALTDRSAA